jgi:DNA-binding NarL/FixJ family response regulator
MTTLLVVDDQALIRDGVAAIMDAEPDFAVVGSAADGAEAVRLVTSLSPDVALMDIRMPSVDGIDATRRIVAAGIRTRIPVLTTYGADDLVLAALRARASGYLLKDTPRASLAAAVRSVAGGEATLSRSRSSTAWCGIRRSPSTRGCRRACSACPLVSRRSCASSAAVSRTPRSRTTCSSGSRP